MRKTFASVRRTPLCAGDFLPNEGCTSVFAWVAEHLRAPLPFELTSRVVAARGHALPREGTLRDVLGAGTAVLNFRWADKADVVEGDLCLSQAALRLVESEDAGNTST